jgi:hypothetical protein
LEGSVIVFKSVSSKFKLKGSFFNPKIFLFNNLTSNYSLLLFTGDLFCKISTLKAYDFQTVWRKNPKFSLKNLKFIRDLVKQIKKYGLRFGPAKSGFLDVNNEKCLFLTQEKTK